MSYLGFSNLCENFFLGGPDTHTHTYILYIYFRVGGGLFSRHSTIMVMPVKTDKTAPINSMQDVRK